jgi:hypothetical protein
MGLYGRKISLVLLGLVSHFAIDAKEWIRIYNSSSSPVYYIGRLRWMDGRNSRQVPIISLSLSSLSPQANGKKQRLIFPKKCVEMILKIF